MTLVPGTDRSLRRHLHCRNSWDRLAQPRKDCSLATGLEIVPAIAIVDFAAIDPGWIAVPASSGQRWALSSQLADHQAFANRFAPSVEHPDSADKTAHSAFAPGRAVGSRRIRGR